MGPAPLTHKPKVEHASLTLDTAFGGITTSNARSVSYEARDIVSGQTGNSTQPNTISLARIKTWILIEEAGNLPNLDGRKTKQHP